MTEDFKKWLCEKAGLDSAYCGWEKDNNVAIHILIKAMWAINAEKNRWDIEMGTGAWHIFNNKVSCGNDGRLSIFYFNDYKDSEQQALKKTLIYIYEQESK